MNIYKQGIMKVSINNNFINDKQQQNGKNK